MKELDILLGAIQEVLDNAVNIGGNLGNSLWKLQKSLSEYKESQEIRL